MKHENAHYGKMQHLSKGQSRSSKICQIAATIGAAMDFIMGLPLTARKYDSILVIVDWFTKFAYFIPMHTHYKMKKYVELYIECILCLHGVPKTIIFE
jgi:hypothetical protein